MKHRKPEKNRTAVIASLAILPLLVLTACSPHGRTAKVNAAPTDSVLTVGLLGDIGQPPDPDVYYANNGLAITLNTYEGLVQYKNNSNTAVIAPRLATSWTVSADHTVYTFKLRPGVTFHDGAPFTSAAVKASFDRRLAVKGGPAYMVQEVTSVATPDDLTAVVTLKAPNAAFLDYLASPYGPKMVSPKGLAQHAGSDSAQTWLQTHDLGTGPYELTRAQVGTKYTLTQYPKYWGTISPFKTVELPVFNDVSALQLALDSGAVSTVVAALPSSSLAKYENNPTFNSDLLPTFQSTLITVNPSRKFFATREARTAFLLSIDQNKLVSQVEGNRSIPATTLYAKGMITDGSDKQNIDHDPTVLANYAKTLPAGTPVVIGYASGNTNAEQMANILAAQLDAIGLTASAQSYPTAEVFGWANDPAKGPDAFIDGNNGPDGGNPYMWGHVFWDKSGGIDYFLCDNPSTDDDLNHAVQTGDTKLFAKAAQSYAATGCFMNLSYNMDWVVSQKWLQGVPASQNLAANELDFSLLSIKNPSGNSGTTQ
jgi:peptide/nickel transport system substrate-binding protein